MRRGCWAQGEAGATNFTRTIAAIDGRKEWKEVHRTTYAREGEVSAREDKAEDSLQYGEGA